VRLANEPTGSMVVNVGISSISGYFASLRVKNSAHLSDGKGNSGMSYRTAVSTTIASLPSMRVKNVKPLGL
jgi:hypothetical protein